MLTSQDLTHVRDSGIRKIFACKNRNSGLWNAESKFHWQRILESSTWNPGSMAWKPDSKISCIQLHGAVALVSLRKQPTFGDATTGFPAKWRLRNERRNSILMTRHYPDLGSASDWLNQISHAARPIRRTTQISVVTRHQYGISALVSQTSFGGETRGSVTKCRLFPQAIKWPVL